jgi:hypothetical protein
MKSFKILWIKDGYIKHECYHKFTSEAVARAYTEGCRDGWNESYEEWIDVILAVDERSTDEIEKYYEEEDKQDEILKQRQANSKS